LSPAASWSSRASRRAGALASVWLAALAAVGTMSACATVGGGAPSGSDEQPDDKEKAAMASVGAKAGGKIVWSSSRLGNHDLFVMNTDGSDVHPITHGEPVDWFPRFSPDGSKILFTRSKKGWVFERDANTDGKWDILTVTPDGKEETKIVDNASWGTWISNDEIIFARVTQILRRKLAGGEETLLVDSAKVPELDGALMQQPEMSKDGHYIAITLRGSKRETGIWDIRKKTWTRTGEGCQINWTPAGDEVYWVHPTGNGGSRVLHLPMASGKAAKSDSDLDAITLIDIPGRRSHEYFPQLSADGKWLVWAATQRGHDHDIADYEIYLWEVGSPADTAVRLTYHSGNDRWPDIFRGAAAAGGGEVDENAEAKTEKTDKTGKAGKADAAGTAETKAAASGGGSDEEDDASAKPAGKKKKKKKK
jgi:Tol biopolymer transport system component